MLFDDPETTQKHLTEQISAGYKALALLRAADLRVALKSGQLLAVWQQQWDVLNNARVQLSLLTDAFEEELSYYLDQLLHTIHAPLSAKIRNIIEVNPFASSNGPGLEEQIICSVLEFGGLAALEHIQNRLYLRDILVSTPVLRKRLEKMAKQGLLKTEKGRRDIYALPEYVNADLAAKHKLLPIASEETL